jgi:CubicO group peptidase (beta-lactamase class C family)
MSTRFARLIGSSLIVIVLAITAGPVKAQERPFDLERTKSVLSGLIERTLKETGVPSISIALVRGDSIVWKAAFGYANVRTKTPATPETMYNAGSTFKAVTATALMQMVEQGKLQLEHPIDRYLGDPTFRDRTNRDQPITFIHLLSHWSGLTSLPGVGEKEMKPIWGQDSPRSLPQAVAALHSIRPPGTQFEYNNYGYGLAGLLLERISGMSYEQYVVDRVLKPLGVATPHPVWPTPDMVEVMALPYEVRDGQPRPAPQVHNDAYPAGNVYLTAEDMARFLGAHVNGGVFQGQRILSERSVGEMRTPRFSGNYGFGFRIRKTTAGHTMIRHTGRLPGMRSIMMGDVDARVGVYYMANATDVSMEIADVAIALLRGEEYPLAERRPITLDPKLLARYVGVYDMEGDVFTIKLREGKLYLDKNGKKETEFLAETPTRFFIRGSAATVEFQEDPNRRIAGMVITDPDWILQKATKRP